MDQFQTFLRSSTAAVRQEEHQRAAAGGQAPVAENRIIIAGTDVNQEEYRRSLQSMRDLKFQLEELKEEKKTTLSDIKMKLEEERNVVMNVCRDIFLRGAEYERQHKIKPRKYVLFLVPGGGDDGKDVFVFYQPEKSVQNKRAVTVMAIIRAINSVTVDMVLQKQEEYSSKLPWPKGIIVVVIEAIQGLGNHTVEALSFLMKVDKSLTCLGVPPQEVRPIMDQALTTWREKKRLEAEFKKKEAEAVAAAEAGSRVLDRYFKQRSQDEHTNPFTLTDPKTKKPVGQFVAEPADAPPKRKRRSTPARSSTDPNTRTVSMRRLSAVLTSVMDNELLPRYKADIAQGSSIQGDSGDYAMSGFDPAPAAAPPTYQAQVARVPAQYYAPPPPPPPPPQSMQAENDDASSFGNNSEEGDSFRSDTPTSQISLEDEPPRAWPAQAPFSPPQQFTPQQQQPFVGSFGPRGGPLPHGENHGNDDDTASVGSTSSTGSTFSRFSSMDKDQLADFLARFKSKLIEFVKTILMNNEPVEGEAPRRKRKTPGTSLPVRLRKLTNREIREMTRSTMQEMGSSAPKQYRTRRERGLQAPPRGTRAPPPPPISQNKRRRRK